MSAEQFISVLLRMIDSNKVSGATIGRPPKSTDRDFPAR